MSVKRNSFIQHLATNNCYLLRHGGNHDIYRNEGNKKTTSVPRHAQLDRQLCNLICKQLEITKFS